MRRALRGAATDRPALATEQPSSFMTVTRKRRKRDDLH